MQGTQNGQGTVREGTSPSAVQFAWKTRYIYNSSAVPWIMNCRRAEELGGGRAEGYQGSADKWTVGFSDMQFAVCSSDNLIGLPKEKRQGRRRREDVGCRAYRGPLQRPDIIAQPPRDAASSSQQRETRSAGVFRCARMRVCQEKGASCWSTARLVWRFWILIAAGSTFVRGSWLETLTSFVSRHLRMSCGKAGKRKP